MATFIGTEINDFQNIGWAVLNGNQGNDYLVSDQPGNCSIYGGTGSDFMFISNATGVGHVEGGLGNDAILGHLLGDALYGGDGDDVVGGSAAYYPSGPGGQLTPFEPSGDDRIEGGAGKDGLYGFDGNDILRGGADSDWNTIVAPRHDNWTNGSTFSVQAGLFGGDGRDLLYGGAGRDLVVGGNGNDKLSGGSDDDILYGAEGVDANNGGGGADIFAFDFPSESTRGSGRDVIADFSKTDHDIISFYYMDANSNKNGDQAFRFIGDEAFHHKAGELRFANHIVFGDTDGDGSADLQIEVVGVNALHDFNFFL